MADDAGFGILGSQILQQVEHGLLLGLSASVISAAFGIETAFIADSEGTAVVVAGMSPTDVLGENGDYLAIQTDVVVVGGLAEAGVSCRNQGFDAERSCDLCGAAVNDQEFHVLALKRLIHK